MTVDRRCFDMDAGIGGTSEKWGRTCLVCGKSVAGERGFAYLKHDNEMLAALLPLMSGDLSEGSSSVS